MDITTTVITTLLLLLLLLLLILLPFILIFLPQLLLSLQLIMDKQKQEQQQQHKLSVYATTWTTKISHCVSVLESGSMAVYSTIIMGLYNLINSLPLLCFVVNQVSMLVIFRLYIPVQYTYYSSLVDVTHLSRTKTRLTGRIMLVDVPISYKRRTFSYWSDNNFRCRTVGPMSVRLV